MRKFSIEAMARQQLAAARDLRRSPGGSDHRRHRVRRARLHLGSRPLPTERGAVRRALRSQPKKASRSAWRSRSG